MYLFVCGTFDHENGKPSSVGRELADMVFAETIMNGGNVNELHSINFSLYDTIIWIPNINNEEDKILPEIKKQNPHAVLVSSKRVVDGKYTEWDVVGRLLASHSNLGLMIEQRDSVFNFKLLDPLGNMYCDSIFLEDVGSALSDRLDYIEGLSRCKSVSVGPAREPVWGLEDFIEVVQATADKFSTHVNANNPNRMLGNASTRCMFGFPAVRGKESILVTRRNIDKKTIAVDGFIETTWHNNRVEFLGDIKPSVDTPVQLMLFEYYPEIRYMIHGHVYIKGAPFTESKIPCGYLEEFNEIIGVIDFKEYDDFNFTVNLLGHGCIVLAKDLSFFDNIEYTNRPLPEA